MSAVIRIALAIAALAGAAAAEGSAPVRVVLADPDPELLSAVETTLAPWKFEIVIEAEVPANTSAAEARATAQTARFVVWRRAGDLVVFDRQRGSAEYREGKAGPLDEADAMAAALTVKTLMRLPPPSIDGELAPGGPELRLQLGLASRITAAAVSARAGGAVLVRPWHRFGWRFGVAGEAGTTKNVDAAGFKGRWSDWALLGMASWTAQRGRWEVEPHLGAGIVRSTIDGTEGNMARTEAATLALFRGGAWVRWRIDRWSLGGSAGLDVVPGAPTYAKRNGNGQIFEVPTIGFAVGVFAAGDLGR